MPTTSFSFSDTLRARERVNRTLIPVRFFQEGVYGTSFEEEPDNRFCSRVDRLAEIFTQYMVKGKHDPQTGWDVVRPNGDTIEVRYRSLSFPTKADSGHTVSMTPKDLSDKTASELFLYVYNPTLERVDLFIFPKKIYKKGVTVRYSTNQQDYTPCGGKSFQAWEEPFEPWDVFSGYVDFRIEEEHVQNVRSKPVVETKTFDTRTFLMDLTKKNSDFKFHNL